MANDFMAIADKIGDALNLAQIDVSNLLNSAPFLAQMPAVGSSDGETHKYVKETGAPVVGFRSVNDGREYDHSVDTLQTDTLTVLDWSWKVDKAVADAWKQGGPEALIQREGMRHLRAALFAFEDQVLNGTVDGAAAGFTGMADVLDDSDDGMVVNAGGTTADVASSVYAVRVGIDDVMSVIRGDQVTGVGESSVVAQAGSSTGEYPAYYTPACTWVGLQVGSAYSFGRICNITTDSGKTLTDDLISSLLSEFPSARPPTHLVMNRRMLKMLQQSRTATSPTGAPAPFPDAAFGIPIVVVDSLIDTEALLTAA